MRYFIITLLWLGVSCCASARAESCLPEDVGPRTLELMATYPQGVNELYGRCHTYYLSKTSQVVPWPDEDHTRAVFATIAAYSARPYGNSISLTIPGLYADPVLDCDNYNVLAVLIYRQLGGEAPWRFVGFYGGALGNHSLGFLDTDRPILLDSTLAIVSAGDFNDLASGQPMVFEDFGWRTTELTRYRTMIRTALETGATEPDDVLYWFPDIQTYIANPASSLWIGSPAAFTLSEDLAR